jgi:hypothetical protein
LLRLFEPGDDAGVRLEDALAELRDVLDEVVVELHGPSAPVARTAKTRRLTGFGCTRPAWPSTPIAVSMYGSNAGPIASAMSPKQVRTEILTFRERTSLCRFSISTLMNAPAYCALWSPSERVMSPMRPTATVHSWLSSCALSAGCRYGRNAPT